jgi:uncharacterized protein (TIGR02996 family)
MSQIDTLAGFYLALKENPGDPVTLLALADWYEENGLPEHASCLRWTAQRHRFPFEYRKEDPGMVNHSKAWTDGWYWWAIDDPVGRGWGHPPTCHLPRPLWKRLENHFPFDVGVFKHFPSLQAAYEALFDVWPLFTPAEREKWS